MLEVIKRDGRKVNFSINRIINAITKAMEQTEKGIDKRIAAKIATDIKNINKGSMKVEEIQDIIEEQLLNSDRKDVAKEYIRYRKERTLKREEQSELFKKVIGLIEGTDKGITDENANKDAKIIPVKRDLLAGIIARYYGLNHMLPKRVKNAHINGDGHFHDLDYSPLLSSFNCMLVDIGYMFKHGFHIGNTEIETPKSFMTACTVTTQIIAHVASSIYGGTTVNEIDKVLSPYVKISFKKHFMTGLYWINDEISNDDFEDKYGEINHDNIEIQKKFPKVHKYATELTKKEVYDGCQTIEYQINSLYTSNGQTPFFTLGFGRGISWEETLIQENILKVRINGLGKAKKTAIFPKLVFAVEEGVNKNPTDKNYNIKQLAIKCATLRMYPDILNVPMVIKNTGSFKNPMGCVDGKEIITYKIDNKLFVESFERMWDRLSKKFEVKEQVSEGNYYINLEETFIYDTKKGFVNVQRIIRNKDKNDWIRIKFSNGRSLMTTSDHPLPIINKGKTFAKDLEIGDMININQNQYSENNINYNIDKAWLLGVILCDGCYDGNITTSLNAIGEDDIIQKYKDIFPKIYNLNITEKEQNRGKKGLYKDLVTKGNQIHIKKQFENLFGGIQKIKRHIPNEVFSWNREAKLSFLAGMIDADGYINSTGNSGSTVQIGSTNKELALQTMALAQSLGLQAKVYLNHYTSKDKNKIRYRIEFSATLELLKYISCNKKIDCFTREANISKTNIASVSSIEFIGNRNEYSYDVTTDSDYFEVSGIYSHNCRSFLSPWYDENGTLIHDGRNNCGVYTINLPRLGIRSNHSIEYFYKLLDEQLEIAYEALMYRLHRFDSVRAKEAPILYCEGAMGVKLNPEDNVSKLFKNGRASISLGYIGVHETILAIFGKHIYDDENLRSEGIKLVKYLHDKCNEWKEKTGYGFSVYSTPAESLCYRFCEIDKKDFGILKGITDKDYYMNSFHLDVTKQVSSFDKIDFEAPYPPLANGGHICYTEFPSLVNNPQALEDVWDYSYDKTDYQGTNTPIDKCFECGFEGEFDATDKGFICPNCGNDNPQTSNVTRRVCGYLGNPNDRKPNKGKLEETQQRVKHM
ncbi:TPA: anaerobic ribonucleoside-triphosphate reductase [Clostridium botulinum]|nr:anaerobic ribonucleoside-triphosphate reductase [Clostridium botulinum]